MAEYIVATPLSHDGVEYGPGAVVELSIEVAEALSVQGVVKTADPELEMEGAPAPKKKARNS